MLLLTMDIIIIIIIIHSGKFCRAKIHSILFKLILIVESFMITLTDTSRLSLAACTEYLSSVFLERDLREI
jgi:hypothetical protein